MKNALTLGALLAVFSLSYSHGDSKSKNTEKNVQDTSREAHTGMKDAVE